MPRSVATDLIVRRIESGNSSGGSCTTPLAVTFHRPAACRHIVGIVSPILCSVFASGCLRSMEKTTRPGTTEGALGLTVNMPMVKRTASVRSHIAAARCAQLGERHQPMPQSVAVDVAGEFPGPNVGAPGHYTPSHLKDHRWYLYYARPRLYTIQTAAYSAHQEAFLDLQLQGKSALVTGASKGIGRATALALAVEGCSVRLAARSAYALDQLRNEILGKHKVRVDLQPGDLSSTQSMVALADAVGDLDILINNTGDIPAGTVEALTDADWRRGFDLN